jgi:glycosyltransferase involved in cell wall biosynthesis
MLKILQINSTANVGSTGRIASEIGQLIKQKGWESYIAYGRDAVICQSTLIRIGSKIDIILHGIKSRLFDKHGLGSVNATKRLIQEIKKNQPDIIHLHNIHGYYLNYIILFDFLSSSGIPVIWTLHDCWSFTGHCSYFHYACCDKWKTQCFKCPQKTKYPASIIIDNSSDNYNLKRRIFNKIENLTIVTVSDWLGGLVKQSFLKDKKIQTIHNGIDTDIFKPKENGNKIRDKYGINNRFMILSVATAWTNRKGMKDLFELSTLITENEVIVMLGLTPKQIKEIPPAIIGLPRTENFKDLADLYSTANVLLSTSYEETFGLTIAESFACGTPAIVYNRTATPYLVSAETGFVVEPKDYNSIISAIQKIKQEQKSKYVSVCRDRALKFFDKNKQFLKYVDLYESKLQKNEFYK